MAALGVPTTRALSLIASRDENDMATRPWYSAETTVDPFYRPVPPHGGDIMHQEFRAITTRVARSFVRVGSRALRAALEADRRPAREATTTRVLLVRARKRRMALDARRSPTPCST